MEYTGVVIISIVLVVLYKRRYIGSTFLKFAGLGALLSLVWELGHYIAGKQFLEPSEEIRKETSMIGYAFSHAFYDMFIFLALAGAAYVLFGRSSINSLDLRVLILYIVLAFAQEYVVEKVFAEKLKMWRYKPSTVNPVIFGKHTVICFVEWICAISVFWLLSGLL